MGTRQVPTTPYSYIIFHNYLEPKQINFHKAYYMLIQARTVRESVRRSVIGPESDSWGSQHMDLVLDSSRQVSGTKDSVSYECETKHVTNPTLLRREASECLRLICKKIVFNYAYVSLGPCRSTLLLFLCMAADKWVCFYALNPSHWSPLLLPMNKNGFFFFSLYRSNQHAMIFVLYSTF